jgi:cytochrome c oxidase accessory protein FixG
MAAAEELVLYQRRIPVYPRSVTGRFRRLKYAILALAYGVYFILPWIRWERANASNQAVSFDIANRRFYLFDLVVDALDIYWLAGFLVIAAMLLFFVTGLFGRAFCGYFCFQTLWTDVFMLIERLIQGERPKRMKLAAAPWSTDKAAKMVATWVAWLGVAMATGITFTLYWGDAPRLLADIFTGQAPFSAYATAAFLTTTTFVFAGLAREQVCTYMCPYARFQSAMFDKDTLIIAYDRSRGEGVSGRHRLGKGYKSREHRQSRKSGDCIDCGYCVQVCPTGIDIRNGLQLQCISCGMCVDACDTIMDGLDWPRGLVGYSSERALEGGRTRILKLKTVGYGLVLISAMGLLAWSVATRSQFAMSVEQLRQPLAVTLSDGRVQNRYEIKLNNKRLESTEFAFSVVGLEGVELDLGNFDRVTLDGGQRLRIQAVVRMPAATAQGQHQFLLVAEPLNVGESVALERPATFYVPE